METAVQSLGSVVALQSIALYLLDVSEILDRASSQNPNKPNTRKNQLRFAED
jgi:hypothetical protein